MPVLNRIDAVRGNRQDHFVAELLAEMRNPTEAEDAPYVIVEREAANQPAKHLFVVWSAWEDLTPLQRSRVVMRAYEQYLGNDAPEITQVTLAMGYLPEEAERMGIHTA